MPFFNKLGDWNQVLETIASDRTQVQSNLNSHYEVFGIGSETSELVEGIEL